MKKKEKKRVKKEVPQDLRKRVEEKAYFNYLKRRNGGLPGSTESDWYLAEKEVTRQAGRIL